MLTPEDAQFIAAATVDLARPLYEGLDKGRLLAHEHYDEHGMNGSGYTKGRTDLTRDHARRQLETVGGLGEWKLGKQQSGRILLSNGLMLIRVLHGAPFPGDTPPPGRNQARVSYYQNPTIDLFGVESSRLLAVWTADESGELSIRIVRPVGSWKFGRNAKTDIDFILPREVEDFTSLEFIPNDDDFTLPFEFDEDERHEEGDTGA
jgi:hypothetical protein